MRRECHRVGAALGGRGGTKLSCNWLHEPAKSLEPRDSAPYLGDVCYGNVILTEVLELCLHTCACVHMCAGLCAHTSVYVHVRACMCAHKCVHARVCARECTSVYKCVRAPVCACVCTSVCVHKCAHHLHSSLQTRSAGFAEMLAGCQRCGWVSLRPLLSQCGDC